MKLEERLDKIEKDIEAIKNCINFYDGCKR